MGRPGETMKYEKMVCGEWKSVDFHDLQVGNIIRIVGNGNAIYTVTKKPHRVENGYSFGTKWMAPTT